MSFSGIDVYTPITKDKRGQKYVGSGSAVLYYSADANSYGYYGYLYLNTRLEDLLKKCKNMNVKIEVAFDKVNKEMDSLLEEWVLVLEKGAERPKKLRGFEQITAFK